MKENRIAIIDGATGLIGTELSDLLQEDPDYKLIKTVGRRKPERQNAAKFEDFIIDLSNVDQLANTIEKQSDVFVCLGTTIKKAGSQKAFRVVDYEYPLNIVKASINSSASSVHLVTALGADSNSSIFYNRVKGELETDSKKLAQQSGLNLTVYRPSLLLGNRNEFRPGEKVASIFGTIAGPLLGGYKPIHARKVALAMIARAKEGQSGFTIIESKEMQ